MSIRSYKIVVLGDNAVGKTSLIVRYVDDSFNVNYKPTLGFDIFVKRVDTPDGLDSLIIWDIGAQEKFEELREFFLQRSDGAILVYDVTRMETFQNMIFWMNTLYDFVGRVPFILVGNKIDLIDRVEISTEKAERFADKIKAINFYECSTKTGIKVNEIFKEMAIKLH